MNRFWLGIDDIVTTEPGGLGPYGYMEIGGNQSGIWAPNPATNSLIPGWMQPNVMPDYPVDLSTMIQVPQGELPPYNYVHLGGDHYVWNPHGPMGARVTGPVAAKTPLDLGSVRQLSPGEKLPPGYMQLAPGVAIPDPAVLRIGTPISATTDTADDPATGTGVVRPALQVNEADLERFAKQHDLNAATVRDWANGDPDFAEAYLRTHGKVNYGTYLRVKEFLNAKIANADTVADRHASTAQGLRKFSGTITGQDAETAAVINNIRSA